MVNGTAASLRTAPSPARSGSKSVAATSELFCAGQSCSPDIGTSIYCVPGARTTQ